MKAYFRPLFSYLMNHPSIAQFSLANKEQQVLAFIKEERKAISLFLYPSFEEDLEEFSEFIQEANNESFLEELQTSFSSSLSELFTYYYKQEAPPTRGESNRLLHQLLLCPSARQAILYSYCFWKDCLVYDLLNGLFAHQDSYTLHLIETEEQRTYSAKMLIGLSKVLMYLSTLLPWYQEEYEKTIAVEDLQTTSLEIHKGLIFLPIDLIEKAICVNFSLQDKLKISCLSRLAMILKKLSEIPMLKDPLAGAVNSEESWFSTQINNPDLDRRIVKELWESYKEWAE